LLVLMIRVQCPSPKCTVFCSIRSKSMHFHSTNRARNPCYNRVFSLFSSPQVEESATFAFYPCALSAFLVS
jgi:hypothetical protein